MRTGLRSLLTSQAIIFIAILLVFSGCKKEEAEKPPTSRTVENLKEAYRTALKRADWYTRFAAAAKKERKSSVAALFQAVARSENIHAANHAAMMSTMGVEATPPATDSLQRGNVLQALKMSANSETLQGSMYAEMVRVAETEQLPEAARHFDLMRKVDSRHLKLFKDAIDLYGISRRAVYYICPECGMIVVSDRVRECPVCNTAAEKFEKVSG